MVSGVGDKKWMNDRNSLKVELTGIVDTIVEVRCERRKGVKNTTEFSGLSIWRNC